MLRLNTQQLATFSSRMIREANLRLIDHIRERFPKKFDQEPEEEMHNLVAQSRIKANQFGIEREDNVAEFLVFSIMYGRNFTEDPWASSILSNKALHGPDKMAVLRHRVRRSGIEL